MKKIFTLIIFSALLSVATTTFSQCIYTIPSNAIVVNSNQTISFGTEWVCSGDTLTLSICCHTVYLEPGAYAKGGSNSESFYVPKGAKVNYTAGACCVNIYFVDSADLISATGANLIQCSSIKYDYSQAPAGGCPFCTSVATMPTSISSSTSENFCIGTPTTLTQVGGSLLLPTAHWTWYEGSCGGTPVDTGSSITVYPTATTTYFIRAEDSCSTSCTSITLVPDTIPLTPNIYGLSSLCGGQSTVLQLLNNPCPGGGCTIQWSSGDTGSVATVSPSVTTTYTITATSGCGISVDTTYTLAVYPTPPTILRFGDLLKASDSTEAGYQWYLNGSPLIGPTTFKFTTLLDGWYKVKITDIDGCTAFSDSVQILSVGSSSVPASVPEFMVSPNPVTGRFTVYGLQFSKNTSLEIFNPLGEKVYSEIFAGKFKTIDIQLKPGIYFVQAGNEAGSSIRGIIVE